MYVVKKYETSVSLFHRDGSFELFKSKKDALNALTYSWICNNVGEQFSPLSGRRRGCPSNLGSKRVDCGRTHCRDCTVFKVYDWVMRDDEGKALTSDDFYALACKVWELNKKGLSKWGQRRKSIDEWNGDGPVPGVSCSKYRGHTYRPVSCIAERRDSIIFEEEGEVPPRGARNHRNLPKYWDDYLVSANSIKSWKRHRKNQWKKDAVSARTAKWNI